MYGQGVFPFSIADVMTEVVKQKGKRGDFLAKTVQNITTQLQTAMDLVAGIDKEWSVAQKTLNKLNERAIIPWTPDSSGNTYFETLLSTF